MQHLRHLLIISDDKIYARCKKNLWAGEQYLCLFHHSNSWGLAGDDTLNWDAVKSHASMLTAFQPINIHQLFKTHFHLNDWISLRDALDWHQFRANSLQPSLVWCLLCSWLTWQQIYWFVKIGLTLPRHPFMQADSTILSISQKNRLPDMKNRPASWWVL